MRLLTLYKENSGVDYHRILLPFKFLELKEGDQLLQISNRFPISKNIFKNINLVFFSRDCPVDFSVLKQFQKEFRFKIGVDIDDYWHLYPHHILYDDWKARGVGEEIEEILKHSDIVTTTHKYLADKIVKFNKNIEILPNALPYDHDQFNDTHVNTENIIYSGSPTHLYDLRSIRRVFNYCKTDKDVQKFNLCLAGYNPGNKLSLEIWTRMENECKAFGNYQRWSFLPLHRYMEHYTKSEIAIAPLEVNEFNKCKSNLKILEAGCKNIPIIASNTHPYTEMPGVQLCSSSKDWYIIIKRLIKDPQLRIQQGKLLGEHVRKNFNLLNVNNNRYQILKQSGGN